MTAKKTVKPTSITEKQSSAQIILEYLRKTVNMSNITSDDSKSILNPVLNQNVDYTVGDNIKSQELTPLFQEIYNGIKEIEENLSEINFTLSNVEVNY
jgi:hypothetical protein